MSMIIPTIFDGKTFVPTTRVDLPVGTAVNVQVQVSDNDVVLSQPRPMTPIEEQEWEEIVGQIRSVPPDPPTFEEYLRQQ